MSRFRFAESLAPPAKGSLRSPFASGGLSRLRCSCSRFALDFSRASGARIWVNCLESSLWQRLMSSVLQHFNFETSAGFVNILVAMLLNRSFIHSFITSRLDNNNALLYGLPTNQLYRLQKIQNTAARILTFSRKSCHITPILKELHWLPINERIILKLLLIVYKCTNNVAPFYLTELISKYLPTRTLRSGNMELLKENQTAPGVIDLSLLQLLVFGINCHLI